MRIGITYNLKDELSPDAIIDSESCEEFDTSNTINAICEVFEKNGHETVKLGFGIDIPQKVKSENIDFVFNIAEGYHGRNRESYVPSILEAMGVPYSGSDSLTLGLTLDKIMSKKITFHRGIPTPRYIAVKDINDLNGAENKLKYPMITKPGWEGSSKGIYNSSKALDKRELERNVKVLFEKYPGQPVLLEEYIKGREITVAVIGNDCPRVLGMMEIVNKKNPGGDIFYSLETKKDWRNLVDYASPPDINRISEKHIAHYALLAFKEFGCRDIARIDFRVSEETNRVFMLEINPLPGLSPEYADLVIMSEKNGIKYEELVMDILNHALSRYGAFEKSAKGKLNYETI